MAQESPTSTSTNDVTQKQVLDQEEIHAHGTSALKRKATSASSRPGEIALKNVNAKLANPLAGYTHRELLAMGEAYARDHGMEELVEDFRKVSGIGLLPVRV